MRASQNLALVGTCRSADATITVSQVLRDLLLDEYGISSELIPNGVDLAQCAVANGTRFLRWSDLSGDFVLWIGSRLKVKRPELLIRIAKEMPEIQFVAIGNGLQKAMAVEVLGELPPNVIAIGPVPHSIILDGMRASKAVLITSRRESFSLAACEGLGCERPAVAPMSVGLDDVVGGVDTRLLYDADEPRTAVQALRFAIEHPESGRRGKNRIAVTHDWRVIAPKIDRLYEEIRGRAGR